MISIIKTLLVLLILSEGLFAKREIVSSIDTLNLSEYQEGSPCLIIYTNGKNNKAFDNIMDELSGDNDVVEITSDKADSSLVFANVERKVTYRGPIEMQSIQSSMRQFDIGSRMARFTDSNFEHDTQASTGSTTGDWLIIFDKLSLESAEFYEGLSLLHRANAINVGIADESFCPSTYKRFGIKADSNLPKAVLLKKKQLYHYPSQFSRDMMATVQLMAFSTGKFRIVEGLPVPRTRIMFDDFLDYCVGIYRNYEDSHGSKRALVALGSIIAALFSLLGLLFFVIYERIKLQPSDSKVKSKTE